MVRLLAALLLLAAPAARPADEARAVLAAALAYEAVDLGDRARRTCVARRLEPALIFLQVLRSRPARAPGQPRPAPLPVDHPWQDPAAPPAESRPVEPALDAHLDRQLAAALAAHPSGRGGRLETALVPSPLRSARAGARCGMTLGLSVPAIVDDVAFIEIDYDCGMGCGGMRLIALQRREGRWTVVAAVGMAVS